MLDWFKRIATPALGKHEHQTRPAEGAVEQLVRRITPDTLEAGLHQTTPAEEAVEQLLDRIAPDKLEAELHPTGPAEEAVEQLLDGIAPDKVEAELHPTDPAEEAVEQLGDRITRNEREAGLYWARPADETVEQLVSRITPDKLVAGLHQTRPAEEAVEQLVGRITPNKLVAGLTQMRIVAVASQKGGVGKTTIAAHLAVQAGMMGQGPVVLVDTDPQGSLTEWWDARKDEQPHDDNMPALATVKLDDLATKLAELRGNGTAIAIVDTPPALTSSIEQVIASADLVVIPARPSPHDLRAIGATVRMTRRAGKPFLFVINGAAPRANITAEAVAALSEHGRVAPIILYQRTDYAASMIDGRTVMETAANGRSTQEMAELWKYVYAQINMPAAA